MGLLHAKYGDLKECIANKEYVCSKSTSSVWWKDLFLTQGQAAIVEVSNLFSYRLGSGAKVLFWLDKRI
ncbi:unnamed protein product [Lathyrus sativus]|nr:unnamed protein product [Lathyrus sativus]